MEALQMATVKELVTELFNRHEATLVVVSGKPKNGTNQSRGEIATFYRGGTVTALGLTEVAKLTLQDHLNEISDEDEEDDE